MRFQRCLQLKVFCHQGVCRKPIFAFWGDFLPRFGWHKSGKDSGIAHAHNEKSYSVTIDETFRYEGVQIVVCANCHRNRLTFLIIRAICRTQANDKKQKKVTENLLKTPPKSAII